jgi:hypothetical protein
MYYPSMAVLLFGEIPALLASSHKQSRPPAREYKCWFRPFRDIVARIELLLDFVEIEPELFQGLPMLP